MKQAPWGLCRRASFQPGAPPSNLCCYSAPSVPYQPGSHPYLGETPGAYLQLCPADSTVPFPSTPSLWGLGILKRPPASHLLLISWVPQALDRGCASPFLLSLLPLGQSQDTGQLFYGKGSSGQHIPSKPRACILAFELCNMGTPLSPRSSPVIKRAELPA